MGFKIREIGNIEKRHHKGRVYDLTVEKDHSYNIEGVIVHNSICSTRIETGHGLSGLQTIFECAQTIHDVAIIADGGIRNSGDIVKALAAGADFVMLGSLLSGTVETPGEVTHDMMGNSFKRYRGMASPDAQLEWRGRVSSKEGIASTQGQLESPGPT